MGDPCIPSDTLEQKPSSCLPKLLSGERASSACLKGAPVIIIDRQDNPPSIARLPAGRDIALSINGPIAEDGFSRRGKERKGVLVHHFIHGWSFHGFLLSFEPKNRDDDRKEGSDHACTNHHYRHIHVFFTKKYYIYRC